MSLFHYTTCDSLEKIFTSGQLLLNRVSDVQDNEEIDNLVRAVDTFLSDEQRNRAHQCLIVDECLRDLQSRSYVACFEKSPDNEHLWNEYAEAGVVIELCENSFPVLFKTSSLTFYGENPLSTFRLVEMQYGDDANFFRRKFLDEDCIQFKLLMSMVAVCYKSEEYQQEEEVRLVYFMSDELRNAPNETLDTYEHLHVNNFQRIVVDEGGKVFYELFYRNGASTSFSGHCVNSITRGVNARLCEDDIQKLLHDHGYGDEVEVTTRRYHGM